MDKVAHLYIEQQRFIHVLDIERVEIAVFGDDAHVRLFLEMLGGSLYTDDILGTVRFSGNQVGGTQVHILDGSREDNMHRLVVGDFQTVRRYHLAETDFAAQSFKMISATLLRIGSHYAHHQGKKHQNLLHIR